MKLHDIMTSEVEVIEPQSTVRAAAQKMKELDVGLIPVCDGDRLRGMLTDRDITVRAVAEGKNPTEVRVEEVMTPEVIYAREDQSLEEGADLMERNQIRRLIILDRHKKMVGIVSLADLAVKTGQKNVTSEVTERVSYPAEPEREAS